MLFAFYPDLDNIGGSANPRIDRKGAGGAVDDTGPAFHAGVEIHDPGCSGAAFPGLVGTDFSAQAAPDALVRVQHQGGYIF